MTSSAQEDLDRAGYDLAKKVPDMRRGFRIETAYGEIEIDASDAPVFAELVGRLLCRKLNAIRNQKGKK